MSVLPSGDPLAAGLMAEVRAEMRPGGHAARKFGQVGPLLSQEDRDQLLAEIVLDLEGRVADIERHGGRG